MYPLSNSPPTQVIQIGNTRVSYAVNYDKVESSTHTRGRIENIPVLNVKCIKLGLVLCSRRLKSSTYTP